MSAWLDPYADDSVMQVDSSPRGTKRPRADEVEENSSPPAAAPLRDDHSQLPHGLRTAMVSTIYARAMGFFSGLWAYITGASTGGEQSITIVASPTGSGKRRYMEQKTPKSVYKATLPGQYPSPSIVLTPPPSRPNSSSSASATVVTAEPTTTAIAVPGQAEEQQKPFKWPPHRRGEVDEYVLRLRREKAKAYEILDDKTRKYTDEERNRYRVHFWEAQRICEERRAKRIAEQKAEQEKEAEAEKLAKEQQLTEEKALAKKKAAEEKVAQEADPTETPRASTRKSTPPPSSRRSQTSNTFSPASSTSPQPLKVQKGYRKLSDRRTASAQEQHLRDSLIDGLIGRAKRVGINSPDARAVHDYRRIKEALVETERLQREQIELKARAEQLRRQKEQEAAAAAAEAAKRAAEEEQAREAAAKKLEAQQKAAAVEEEKGRQRAADRAAAQAQLEAEAEDAFIDFIEDQSRVTSHNHLLVRPLEADWDARLRIALATNNGNKQLALSKNGYALSRADFGRLVPTGSPVDPKPEGWLNDEIINAWFEEITAKKDAQTGWKKNSPNPRAFVAYNSAWITTWQRNGGAHAIKNWSRRQGIAGERLLQAQKIFFPVNNGAHWTLLVISPQERKIEYLDSLHGSTKPYFKMAREWLAMELGKAYVASEWRESPEKSQKQLNMSDCGAFTCFNALAAAKGYSYDDVQGETMSEARRLMAAVFLNGGLNGEYEL